MLFRGLHMLFLLDLLFASPLVSTFKEKGLILNTVSSRVCGNFCVVCAIVIRYVLCDSLSNLIKSRRLRGGVCCLMI